MNSVEPFVSGDVQKVADLFSFVFRGGAVPAPASLGEYIRDLYLENPLTARDLSSFVHRTPSGDVSGFIGSLVRRMAYNGREIRVVVAGNHMVDPRQRDPFAGTNLLKRLLDGPQDLTLTDSANETSRRLWERMGAKTLLNYSLRWLRILRPASFPLTLLRSRAVRNAARVLLSPVTALGNRVAAPFQRPIDRSLLGALVARPLEADQAAASFAGLVDRVPLKPVYDHPTLDWLMAMAARKEQFGPLKSRAVFENGNLIGWHLSHRTPGETAQVLQVVASAASIGKVMTHLFASVAADGCPAVTGSFDPRFVNAFHELGCMVFLRPMYTIVHAKSPEIVIPFIEGSAFLSRLDGEWWTRLQGDRFE